jgi:hypothetical protein
MQILEIPPTVLTATYKFLGEENIRWFGHVKGLKGSINTVLHLNYAKKKIPVHPIHFREGMQVRNFLRGLPECKDITFEDMEGYYIEVIEKLILRQKEGFVYETE